MWALAWSFSGRHLHLSLEPLSLFPKTMIPPFTDSGFWAQHCQIWNVDMKWGRKGGLELLVLPSPSTSAQDFYIFVNVKLSQSSLVCLFVCLPPSQSHPSLFARTGDPCGRPDWAPLTIPWLWKLDLECWWVAVFHQWKNFQIEIVGKEFSIVCDLSKIYSKLPANLAAPGKRRPGLDARV